ncbi:hypothetical protein N752_29310 [Desulforamulus aquiferis]|nr:DUF4163 domain-containing protein [Desulforamulus aquiferis]RYD01676.1 hypothetical protein N752_29310 [Desulforamulus aquiferis]
MKKILLLILFAVLVTASGCGAADNNVTKQEKVTITEKTENIETETINIQLQIPQITDMQNTEAQAEFNKKFDSVYELKETLEREAEEAAIYSEQQGFPFWPYELFSKYNVSYNQRGYLSLTTTVYSFTGGAHGLTGKTTYNIDINSGNIIQLQAMFNEGVDYKKIINKEIRNQIAQQPEIYFDGEMGFNTISDEQNFYLKEGKIVSIFHSMKSPHILQAYLNLKYP